MKIAKIEINGLFAEKNIVWNVDPQVNILVGQNGTGKSTIFKIISLFLTGNECDEIYRYELEKLFDNAKIYCVEDNGEPFELDKFHKNKIQFVDEHTYEFDFIISDFFETPNGIKDNCSPLLEVMNEFLSMINKEIKYDYNKFVISNKTTNIETDWFDLSHGERYLLNLLLKVWLSKEKKHNFVLLHTPENHLHLNWQENLISRMIKLNPNAQFFIKTHSPAMIMNGWIDDAIDIEEISTPI